MRFWKPVAVVACPCAPCPVCSACEVCLEYHDARLADRSYEADVLRGEAPHEHAIWDGFRGLWTRTWAGFWRREFYVPARLVARVRADRAAYDGGGA